jgi:hypothetical protein
MEIGKIEAFYAPWSMATRLGLSNNCWVNGNAIDWNIVESHDLNSDDKDITLLGLITNAGTKLNVVAPGTQNEISGHMLWLTHYLKLDGFY